jgi:DNA integrity scanning protein DisA with diadenylate cyclase activity
MEVALMTVNFSKLINLTKIKSVKMKYFKALMVQMWKMLIISVRIITRTTSLGTLEEAMSSTQFKRESNKSSNSVR